MKKLIPDGFTLLLLVAIILASVAPISGNAARWFGYATHFSIMALFFLYGTRLERNVVIAGFTHWRLQGLILVTTFVLFPLLGLLLGFLSPWLITNSMYNGILFLCLLPTTVQSSIALTSIAGGNISAALCASATSNLLGIVFTPVLFGLLISSNSELAFSWPVLQNIVLLLLLPFVLGQIFQPKFGMWVSSNRLFTAPIDRGSILMVVYMAFSAATVEGIWKQTALSEFGVLIAASLFLLLSVLWITTIAAKLLSFNTADLITAMFCGSQKSLATGVPIASVIFAGQAIGPIVLPLMIYHQIQLIFCAWIARTYSEKIHESI